MIRSPFFTTCVVATVLLCSCGPSRTRNTSANNTRDPARLVAEAEQALARARTLDYRTPQEGDFRAAELAKAASLYLEACRLGERAACWRAASVADPYSPPESPMGKTLRKALTATAKNCVAKDAMSCRALTSGILFKWLMKFPSEELTNLCDAGVGAACTAAGDQRGEIDVEPIDPLKKPAAQLPWYERGCDLGDARSCVYIWGLAKRKMIDADPDVLRPRAVARATAECDANIAAGCVALYHLGEALPERGAQAATEGCFAGLLSDCDLLPRSADAPISARGMELRCSTYWSGDCSFWAASLEDPVKVRDWLEHSCQLGDPEDCLDLMRRYASGELPEPVAGRRLQLAKYLCEAPHYESEGCELLEAEQAPASK